MHRTLTLPQGLGLLLAATLLWGGMFPLGKWLLQSMDAYVVTSIRYGLAALLFLAVLRWREGPAALRTDGHGWALWRLGTVGFAGFNLMSFVGLSYTRPEHAAVIVALMPLITVVIVGLRTGVRPRAATLMAIGLALAGVALVISGGRWSRLFGGDGLLGDAMVLAAAVCWVTYTLGAQRFPHFSPLRYTALSCAFGAISILGILAARLALGWSVLPAAPVVFHAWWAVIYLVAGAAFVAVLGWNAGIRRVGPQGGVLFINIVPVTTMAIGAVQGHPVSSAAVVGAALVMAGLVLNSTQGVLAARWQRSRQAAVCPGA